MNEAKPPGKIFKALHAIMSEVGAISKDNKNSFQSYSFRSVAQAMAALQPLLIKNGVVLQPGYEQVALHDQEKGFTATCMLALTFWCIEDESCLTVRVPGQGADSSDKALAKALAMAFKYAVFQTLSIPEDGTDSEFATPEVKTVKKAAAGPKSIREMIG